MASPIFHEWLGHTFQVEGIRGIQLAQNFQGAGIYIFATPADTGWSPLYVGKSDDLPGRVNKDHEKWVAAVAYGDCFVHFMREDDELTRTAVEETLIKKLHPPLNIQHNA